MGVIKDRVGQKFGRLLVQSFAGKNKWNYPLWNCLCDCNNQIIVSSGSLTSGGTQSCGCLRKERASKANKTHGYCGTPLYQKWADMIRRCNNKKCKSFPKYGAAGITVCERWLKFENFLEDMGECPAGLTLDRIDNFKGYEPENCRWATRKTQSINRKHIKLYTMNGKAMTLADWSKQLYIDAATLRKNIGKGYSLKSTDVMNAIKIRETLC
jgi:hypothetical protein